MIFEKERGFKMPIYEYCCESCGYRFERIQRTALPQEACPSCGAAAHRCVSAAAVPPISSGCGPRGGFT